jgi:Zn-finger nucleic acid-binding protein
MCPNDDAPMQTLERAGVQFDMCPTCRGVWLDRGELEKLMDSAVASAAPVQPAYAPPPQQQPWGQPQQQGYREQPRYRDDDDHRYKKKKRDSIFDIFD